MPFGTFDVERALEESEDDARAGRPAMSTDLVLLAVLMGAVTYPSRALPMLAPGIERLPPARSSTCASSGRRCWRRSPPRRRSSTRTTRACRRSSSDPRSWACSLCMAIVWWRRNLFLGLLAGVVLVALLRVAGIG